MKFYTAKEGFYGFFIWGIVLVIVAGLFLIFFGGTEVEFVPVVILLALMAFMITIWYNTYYELKEEYLLVHFGVLRDKIYYKDITNLEKSRSILSSYALSRDRIAIYTQGKLKAFISPLDRENFLYELSKHMDLSLYSLDSSIE